MQKILTTAIAATVLATSGMSFVSPASADMRGRERYVERYCANNPRDNDCRDWRRDTRRWDNARYQGWYRRHQGNSNDAAAAALFGFAAGAIVAGAAANANQPRGVVVVDDGHAQRCAARYRSYDPASDTFLAYSGQRLRCNL